MNSIEKKVYLFKFKLLNLVPDLIKTEDLLILQNIFFLKTVCQVVNFVQKFLLAPLQIKTLFSLCSLRTFFFLLFSKFFGP